MSPVQTKCGANASKVVENLLKVIHVLEGPQQCLWAAINRDRRLTVWKLEADLGSPKTTVSEILTQDFGMKHVMTKFIPWILLPEQKQHHAVLASDLIQTTTNEPHFLRKVITRDESWVCAMIRKGRPSRPSGSRPVLQAWRRYNKVAARSRPCSLCFSDWEGVVYHKCASPGQKVNKKFYPNVLRWLRHAAMGSWWLAALSQQRACSCVTPCAELFWQNIKSPRWLSPPTAQIWHPVSSCFSQN